MDIETLQPGYGVCGQDGFPQGEITFRAFKDIHGPSVDDAICAR